MLFTEAKQAFARAVGELGAGNPFLPERLEAERAALGDAFDVAGTLWHSPTEPEPAPNVVAIAARATELADAARARLAGGARPRAEEVAPYEDLVLYALYERHQGALFAWFRARPAPTGKRAALRAGSPRPRALPRRPGVREPAPRRGRARLRRLLPGAAGLPPYPREHPRRVGPGAAPARGGLAVDLHPRRTPLPAGSLRADGRRRHPRHRPLRHGQGARRARDRARALHPLRCRDGRVRGAGGRRVLSPEPRGALPHPHRVRALRSPARRLHRRARGPEGLVRGVPRARHGLPGRDRRGRRGDPGEAPPRATDAAPSSASATPRTARSRGSSSPPRTAISGRRSPPAASGRTSTTACARTSSSRRPSPSGSGTRRARSERSAARSPAASRATRRPTRSPRRPRPGSPSTSGRTTRGPATCASSSSASGTS